MIAVIFEVWPKPEHRQDYFELAADLKPILQTIDGFISVERFESLTEKGKILSVSFWRDEAALQAWRNTMEHRRTQAKGRAKIFADYHLRIASVIRDYSMNDREQAPKDSRAVHDAHKRPWRHVPISARPTRERNMHVTTADKRAAFRKLHESGCFILPNPVDVGSAKALQHLGFKALASSSPGFAWTIGTPDNHVTVEDVCQHLATLSSSVDIPVNADFEGGFAVEPDKVADNVERCVRPGFAGLSIEDSPGKKEKPIYERALAVER